MNEVMLCFSPPSCLSEEIVQCWREVVAIESWSGRNSDDLMRSAQKDKYARTIVAL